MKKLKKRCLYCKFCLGDHTFQYCASSLSSYYMEEIYPLDDSCEVFCRSRKKKKDNRGEYHNDKKEN